MRGTRWTGRRTAPGSLACTGLRQGEAEPYDNLNEAWFKLGEKETDAYVRAHPSEFCIR